MHTTSTTHGDGMKLPPLIRRFPGIGDAIPHRSLGSFPTPVERMETLGGRLGIGSLHVKRDDASGHPYGGNKVRKLEFLLAEALDQGRKRVITFGGAGSNHALATSAWARETGLSCTAILLPQLNAHAVRRNLLMHLRLGTDLVPCPSFSRMRLKTMTESVKRRILEGRAPSVIPMGGTSPLGTLGYVNAGFELADQIEAGLLPAPDIIFLPLGTMGTAVGLALGAAAAGLPSRIAAVRVVDNSLANMDNARALFRATNDLLADADPTFGTHELSPDRFMIEEDFFGGMYGRHTKEGLAAVDLIRETEKIELEGTYTGKALAALIAHAERGILAGKSVLFVNTYNSRDFSPDIAGLDWRRLPKAFHRYFENDVQRVDREFAGRGED